MSGSAWKAPCESVITSIPESRQAARATASAKGQDTDALVDAEGCMEAQRAREAAMSTDPSALRDRSESSWRRSAGPGQGQADEAPGISSQATMTRPEAAARATRCSNRSLAWSSFSDEDCAKSTSMMGLRADIVRSPQRPRWRAWELRFYR